MAARIYTEEDLRALDKVDGVGRDVLERRLREVIASLTEHQREVRRDRDYDAMLANLSATQTRCTELLNERRDVTAIAAGLLGPTSTIRLEPRITLAVELLAERRRQDQKWGPVQQYLDRPDGTGGTTEENDSQGCLADARERYRVADEAGELTWAHILDEEHAEVIAEADPDKLVAELVQLAAVALKHAEAIRLRQQRVPAPVVREVST